MAEAVLGKTFPRPQGVPSSKGGVSSVSYCTFTVTLAVLLPYGPERSKRR